MAGEAYPEDTTAGCVTSSAGVLCGPVSTKSARDGRLLVASPFGDRSVHGRYPLWHGSQWRARWQAAHVLRTSTRNRSFAILCHKDFTSAGPAVNAMARRAVGLCMRSVKGDRPVPAGKLHASRGPHADDPTSNSQERAVTAGLDPTLPRRNSRGRGTIWLPPWSVFDNSFYQFVGKRTDTERSEKYVPTSSVQFAAWLGLKVHTAHTTHSVASHWRHRFVISNLGDRRFGCN